MEKANTGDRDDKKMRKNKLISYLRAFPATSIEEQARLLDVQVRAVKDYHKELVQEGRAIDDTVAPTGKLPNTHDRFFVFIETTFQLGLSKANHKGDDALRYQEWVAEKVQRILWDHFSDSLTSGGVYILLGGEWDLMLVVDADRQRHEAMHDFVTQHIRTCPHVLRTSTTWARTTAKYPVTNPA